jgi:2-dehydro-3-deoxygluconokinase
VRLGQVGPLAVDAEVDPRILGELAILTLNEAEAAVLAGGTAVERLRSLGVGEIVLTLASRGSVVVTPGAAVAVTARRVDGPVDPTGAGDSFALVYLDSRARGATPVEAAERASEAVAELITRS